MDKCMFGFNVQVKGDDVLIKQENETVAFAVDQIDLVVELLREAQKEIRATKK
jgi:hypothetical protein